MKTNKIASPLYWEDCRDCNTKDSVEVKTRLCHKTFRAKKTWLCRRCGTKTVRHPERIATAKAGL